MSGPPRLRLLVAVAVLALGGCGASIVASASAGFAPTVPTSDISHREYVFQDGAAWVYDIDHGMRALGHISLPGVNGVRGVAADIALGTLIISHGGDGGTNGSGSLTAYNLIRGREVWDRSFSHGVDSLAISRDGRRVFLPDGEIALDNRWWVLNARRGSVLGAIRGGGGPHNTVAGASGRYVYLGGRSDRNHYVYVADARSGRPLRRLGPLFGGVRPFTVDGRDRFVFTTASGRLGFQVASVATGRVLYTVNVARRFPYDVATFPYTTPSHGISLSPDGRQLWVIDSPHGYVHAYDVTGLPGRAPRPMADIRLPNAFTGSQTGCSYDCGRDGWLQHSLSGCYVFVGDSGWVINASTMRPYAYLPALRNSREELEIDWRHGKPIATSSRTGLGYTRPPTQPHCP